MRLKRPLLLAWPLVLIPVAVLLLAWWNSSRDRPGKLRIPRQVIVISLDTLRADMLTAYGYSKYPTSPFLDSFAKDNVLFENCIVQEPRTLTSHMSFFTGLLPQHHKVEDDAPLAREIPTLTTVFKKLGYATQAFVDGGYLRSRWGFDRGFDEYTDAENGGLERIIPLATEWLKMNKREKFFLFVHTYDIHSKGAYPDYRSPPPFRGLFSDGIESELHAESSRQFAERWKTKADELSQIDKDFIHATYAEGIRYVDERLRAFFDLLKELDIYRDALIIVWSDHGEGLFDHQIWAHGELYDHTIRVPLIMKIPGIELGIRIRSLVSSVDLAPTILELIDEPAAIPVDGNSVLRLLHREDSTGLAYSLKIKAGKRRFSVRSLTHHYYFDQNSGERYFFDLEKDPKERDNLYPARTPAARLLQGKLSDFIEEHDRAWSTESSAEPLPLDPVTMDRLRSLGYLSGDG